MTENKPPAEINKLNESILLTVRFIFYLLGFMPFYFK